MGNVRRNIQMYGFSRGTKALNIDLDLSLSLSLNV